MDLLSFWNKSADKAHNNMINLQLASKLIDEALAQETTESVNDFLATHPDTVSEFESAPLLAEQVAGFTGEATTVPLEPWHGSLATADHEAMAKVANPEALLLAAGDYSYAMAA